LRLVPVAELAVAGVGIIATRGLVPKNLLR